MKQKDIFKDFLRARFPDGHEQLLRQFERYHSWLVMTNRNINLVSRQTDPNDYWTLHFLDSLLSIDHVAFGGKSVLDFGSGGGLPGIPIAIVYNNSRVTMLDSRRKKIDAIMSAAEFLELDNCGFIGLRLEELGADHHGRYDLITCRSVRITPAYKKALLKLLRPGGNLVLYKGESLDDVRQFENAKIFDVGIPELGARRIAVA